MAAGLEAEGPLRDRVSFRWWISFLMEGQGDYWASDLKTPEVLTCSLWDADGAPHSPGSSHLPHAPPHSALPPTLPSRHPQYSLKDPHPTAHWGREVEGALLLPSPTLTEGLRAAPGCTCHHPAWLRCAQPRWPGQWLGGHPAPGPEQGQEWAVRPGGLGRVSPDPAQDGAQGRQETVTARAWNARHEHTKLNYDKK